MDFGLFRDFDRTKDPNTKTMAVVAMLLPFLAVFASQASKEYRSSEEDGACVAWRPPPILYSIVWVVLAFTCGMSWAYVVLQPAFSRRAKTRKNTVTILFTLVFSLVAVWQFTYHKKHSGDDPTDTSLKSELEVKREGLAVFILLVLLITALMFPLYSISPLAAAGVAPLLVWGLIQLFASISELQCLE